MTTCPTPKQIWDRKERSHPLRGEQGTNQMKLTAIGRVGSYWGDDWAKYFFTLRIPAENPVATVKPFPSSRGFDSPDDAIAAAEALAQTLGYEIEDWD